MSLVFGAIVPHPPILIPSIGKENLDQINETKESLTKLEQDLYASKPDTLIIISPHGDLSPAAFTFNIADHYEINFESFGDFATKLKAKGDTVLISSQNKEMLEKKFPINIISEPKLDHGVSVPYYYLGQHLESKLLPVYFSLLNNQDHWEFGKLLKEVVMSTTKRVAVIASGDLSHCLNKDAPAKFHPDGKKFDETLITLLKDNQTKEIVSLDEKLTENAAQCGLSSILILLGVFNNIKFTTEIISYEAPFGVGYLTANLKLE